MPRAVAIGTFDGVHIGHRVVVGRGDAARASSRRSSRSTHIRGRCSATTSSSLATLERRLELLAELGVEETLVVEFTPEVAALAPEEFAALLRARDRRASSSPPARRSASAPGAAGTSALLEALGRRDAGRPARPRRLLDPRSGSLVAAGEVRGSRGAARTAGRGGGDRRLGRCPRRHARIPDREPPRRPRARRPRATGSTPGRRSGTARPISIGVNPHYGGAERRIEAFLLDFEGDLYGQRLVVELWDRLRDEAVFESEAELIAQIARDVEADRAAATRP